MSGGHVRVLLQLIRTAIDWTEELPISMESAKIAIEETRDTYRYTILDGQWEYLAEVSLDKKNENSELNRRLLLNRCLLEYRYYDEKGQLHPWCNVHPLIEGLEQFQDALQKVKSHRKELE